MLVRGTLACRGVGRYVGRARFETAEFGARGCRGINPRELFGPGAFGPRGFGSITPPARFGPGSLGPPAVLGPGRFRS